MPIEIDISGVPVEKRTHPDFLKLSRQMQAALDNPKWPAAFTIHEAGHRIYLSRLGITDFRFIGPRIIYDEQKNDFDGYPVAVKEEPVPLSAEGFDFNKWLVQLAQAKAAGGVFSRRLTAAPDHGDAEDREEFSRACDLLRGQVTGPTNRRRKNLETGRGRYIERPTFTGISSQVLGRSE